MVFCKHGEMNPLRSSASGTGPQLSRLSLPKQLLSPSTPLSPAALNSARALLAVIPQRSGGICCFGCLCFSPALHQKSGCPIHRSFIAMSGKTTAHTAFASVLAVALPCLAFAIAVGRSSGCHSAAKRRNLLFLLPLLFSSPPAKVRVPIHRSFIAMSGIHNRLAFATLTILPQRSEGRTIRAKREASEQTPKKEGPQILKPLPLPLSALKPLPYPRKSVKSAVRSALSLPPKRSRYFKAAIATPSISSNAWFSPPMPQQNVYAPVPAPA